MDQQHELTLNKLDAAASVRGGWAAIKPHYPLFLAMIFIQVVAGVLSSFVPFIGSILSGAIGVCLVAGMFMAMFGVFRGESPKVQLMFEGFSRFVPLFVFVLIQTIPFVIVAAIAVSNGMLPEALTSGTGQEMTPEQLQEIIAALDPRLLWLYAGAWAAWIVMKALMFFAVPLVADRDINAPTAIGLSVKAFAANIGGVAALIAIQAGLFIAGLLMLGIGLFFVAPVIYVIEAAAYRDVFGIGGSPEIAAEA